MANFVLVHGAWHGGWCWRDVAQALVCKGHRAYAITLTGVGERAHLLSSEITLETHIADVVNSIVAEELDDVVLAVHSYAGMIGTAIADRHRQLLHHLVYLDAVVPRPGESWSSTHPRATREARLEAARQSPDFSFPTPDTSAYGLSADQQAWLARRLTPHPGHTYEAPLDFDPRRVARVPRTFVNCTLPALPTIDAIRLRVVDRNFWGGAWTGGGGGRVVKLRTGHDAMISAPDEMTAILEACG
ncbi:MAG: alpha/beta fold hydrolase [Halobacteriota archaeon]